MDCEGGLHEESIGALREAIATGVNIIMVTEKVGTMHSWYLFTQY